MESLGFVAFLGYLAIPPACFILTEVAIWRLARRLPTALEGVQPSLRPTATLAVILGALGFLGTTVGVLGLAFAGLWAASRLMIANAEVRAARGQGRSRERSFLKGALVAEGVVTAIMAVSLIVGLSAALFDPGMLGEGGNALYGAIMAQYAVSMAAVAVCDFVSARRLARLVVAAGPERPFETGFVLAEAPASEGASDR